MNCYHSAAYTVEPVIRGGLAKPVNSAIGTVCALIAMVVFPGIAVGQDSFVITGAETATNGGNTLNGGDNITVTETGSVTTNVRFVHGLDASGNTNSLTNSGTVTTSGIGGYGIYANGANNSLSNNGTVTTSGRGGYGIFADGANNSLSNNGILTTTGNNAVGIIARDNSNVITNVGTVTTEGALSAIGIETDGDANTVINRGFVTTNGGDGIQTRGAGATVTNSGTVISAQNFSLDIGGPNSTVNLLEGSVLYGDVKFATAASATLNFGAGLNASVNTNNTIPNTITVANGSYVVAGSTIHAVDANSFAASDQTPGVMGGMILDTLDMQVTGTPVGVTRGASASSTGWIEGFGGRRRHDGNSATMAFTNETYGVMAGRSLDAMSGLFVGAARNTTASDRTFDNRSDSVFAGYHSRYDLGGIEMDASLTFGAAQNNTSRRIANNTVLTGLETARGQYMSYFLMPSATFRGDWDFGDTGFETSVRVRYAAMHDQGYTETGSAAAMTVDGRTSHLGEVRLQVDGALLDQVTASGVFMANLRLGADVQYLHNEHVSGSVAGQSIAFATNGDRVSRRAFAGLNIMHSMADGTRELRGGFEVGRTQSGISDVSASLRWQVRF